MRNLGIVRMGALLLLATAAVASADELDQEFLGPGDMAAVTIDDLFDQAQTFTVGIAGTLTTVDASLAKSDFTQASDELIIDVRPTDENGKPLMSDATALGSVTLLGSQLGGLIDDENLFTLDFTSAGIQVAVGERLALVARSTVPFATVRAFHWGAKIVDGEGYPGGSAWRRGNGDWELQTGGTDFVDLVFRTYVQVPEPAGAALAVVAIATLSAIARGRNARRG